MRQQGIKKKSRDRVSLLFYILLICLVAISLRLFKIQTVDAKMYDSIAMSQRLRRYVLAPDRGTIFDRNGESLAISTDMDTIFATPYQVKDKRKTSRVIASILGEDTETIFGLLSQKTGFVYLARKIDKEKAERLKEKRIEGLGFVKESKRIYPEGSLAAHLIGFAGLDNNGLAGLELQHDSNLKGKPGELVSEEDPRGHPIPGGKYKFIPATNGRQMILTIDKEIQYKAEVELKSAIDTYKAKGGSIVVMNPKTGEVYALANLPAFDLNDFSKVADEQLRNRAIADVFEPGSTMKIVTAAAALEEKLYTPESRFTLPGSITVGGWLIHEAHARGTEEFTLTSIVTKSSNIGAVTIGQKLGKERLYDYIKKFGLNRPAGIDLPGESQGFVPEPSQWSGSTIANIPFGQGMSATPLEMLGVFNTIANGGKIVRPRIVSSLIDRDGKYIDPGGKKDKPQRVISEDTAAKMSKILVETVNAGTGKSAKIAGYSVGGKTGTAQKPNIGKRGYSGQYIGSFAGFVPASNPRLAIIVTIDEPQDAIYGGVVAAPVFSKVGGFALQRLRILPDSAE